MPFRGILNTARSLSFYTRVLQVTGHNLANAGTDGFKFDRMSAFQPAGSTAPVPVQLTDFRQGSLVETGRRLDLALEGPGFFVVQTDQGERLSRGGTLKLDPAGQLTDVLGAPVLGTEGPVVIFGKTVEIGTDGTIAVDGAVIDRLRMETVEDPNTLLKEGFGRFVPASDTTAVEEGSVKIRQGMIEESNGEPLTAMLDLVRVQRAYSANIDALKTMDGVLGAITNDVGRVQ